MNRMLFQVSLALVAGAAAFTGCSEDKPAGSEAAASASAAADGAGDVDLKGGTEHDPPIEVSAVEEGHWYCDMGTAHYSRADKGDGKCPLCKMDLTEKKAE